MVFFLTNVEVRTLSQFHFKVYPINGRNPTENIFLKSNPPILSYQPSSTSQSAKVVRMASTAWLVNQKGLIGFQKILFHEVPTVNFEYFEVKLGWCSDLHHLFDKIPSVVYLLLLYALDFLSPFSALALYGTPFIIIGTRSASILYH